MYIFNSPASTLNIDVRDLPVDDMMVNGNYLSDIDGYRQFHVSGRGILSQRLNLIQVPARAGAFLDYETKEVRIITVTYMLTGRSSNHLREIYQELNDRLSGRLKLRFDDEPEWEYEAVLSKSDNKPEQSYQFTGSFELTCWNPYKQLDPQESTGLIRLTHAEQVLPERVEATVSVVTDTIEILNGTKKVGLVGNYNAGDKLVIEWLENEVKITVNTVNKLHELRFFDYPETFFIKDGDKITGTNVTITKVTWRDEVL